MATGQVIFYTKGYLLDLKKRVKLLKEGFDILSKKRDELISKLMDYLEELKKMRETVISELINIYSQFLYLYSSMSENKINAELVGIRGSLVVNVLPISVMGVVVPQIKLMRSPNINAISNVQLVSIVNQMNLLLGKLLKLIELEAKIESIAWDLQMTNRIVNALEKIVIPDLEETIRKINDMIEEDMLEEFTRIKRIRDIILKRREGK